MPSPVGVVLSQCEPDGWCCTAGAAAQESAQGCSKMQNRDKRRPGEAESGVVTFTVLIGNVCGVNYFQNCRQVLFQKEQIHSSKNIARE